MFKRNSNPNSGSQCSSLDRSMATGNETAADFYSAASSPSNLMMMMKVRQPSWSSTTMSNSHSNKLAKIIDVQKRSHSKGHQRTTMAAADGRDEDEDEDEDGYEYEDHRRSATISSTGVGAGDRSSNRNNSNILAATSNQPAADATLTGGNSNSNRWAQVASNQPPIPTNQKQPSGETLSSFESDYDLLVYLGETETEDIVDTERSLDYQDHTWRQSICGASLAPTIDESLSELIGHSATPNGQAEFDLLNAPGGQTFGGPSTSSVTFHQSPFDLQACQPQPWRSVSSQQLSNASTGGAVALAGAGKPPTLQNQQLAPASSKTLGHQYQQQQQNPRKQQVFYGANSRPWQQQQQQPPFPKGGENYDECDSEVSLVFSENNNNNKLANHQVPYKGTGNSEQESKRYEDSGARDYAANLPVALPKNWRQQTNEQSISSVGLKNKNNHNNQLIAAAASSSLSRSGDSRETGHQKEQWTSRSLGGGAFQLAAPNQAEIGALEQVDQQRQQRQQHQSNVKSKTLATTSVPSSTGSSYYDRWNSARLNDRLDNAIVDHSTNKSPKIMDRNRNYHKEQPAPQVADELDRILAEMSQSLDLDALARYDTRKQLPPNQQQPTLAGNSSRATLYAGRPAGSQHLDSSQSMGSFQQPSSHTEAKMSQDKWKYQQQDNYDQNRMISTKDDVWMQQPGSSQHLARSKSSTSQKFDSPGQSRSTSGRQQQQQASSESILDEYDGASRMLEQMISDQLEESRACHRKSQDNKSKLKQAATTTKRSDSLGQIVTNVAQEPKATNSGSRDSPKSIISAYNYPIAASGQPRTSKPPAMQRPTAMGSSRSSKGSSPTKSSTSCSAQIATRETPSIGDRKVSTCSSSVATEISVKLPASRKVLTSPKDGASGSTIGPTNGDGKREIMLGTSEPLERRSIWRPSGGRASKRLSGRRARDTSNSSDSRRSIESSASQLGGRGGSKPPPTPPAVDYQAEDSASLHDDHQGWRFRNASPDDHGLIRAEASELPPESSSSDDNDDDDNDKVKTVPESQMNRMKRRTLSSYRSMRNRISDFMAGDQASGANKTKQLNLARAGDNKRSHGPPAPPKRSSSIGSRSELVGPGDDCLDRPIQVAGGEPPVGYGAPRQNRESRALKRQAPTPPDASASVSASGAKGPSLGQQIRERLSRSKSRLSKLLSRSHRAKSQPAKSHEPDGQTEPDGEVNKGNQSELLFQPGDLARNWTSAERCQASPKAAVSEPELAETGGGPADLKVVNPVGPNASTTTPIPPATSNSSLSGLDISRSPRAGRSLVRRKQHQPPSRASNNNGGSRPASLISLKRLSASLRAVGSGSKGSREDEARGSGRDESLESLGGKLSKRAKRRRHRQGAAGKQLNGSTGNTKNKQTMGPNESSSGAEGHGQVAARVSTTDEYFGQVAPPRVDSKPSSTDTSDDASSGDKKPVSVASNLVNSKPKRPSRSQSLRSVRLLVPQRKLVAEAEDSPESRRKAALSLEAQKRTVSFSSTPSNNLNRRLPVSTNTFRPASAGAQLDPLPVGMQQPETNQPELSLLVTPVSLNGSATCHSTTTTTTTLSTNNGPPIFRTPPPPEPTQSFGQHLLHPIRPSEQQQQHQDPASTTRSKSATMLDDIRYKCTSLFASPTSAKSRRNNPPPAPTGLPLAPKRPPRSSRPSSRVRSKSAMENARTDQDGEQDHVITDYTIDASSASSLGPSSLEALNGARSRKHPSRASKLSSFAQQLKLSASDFFQVATTSGDPTKLSHLGQAQKSTPPAKQTTTPKEDNVAPTFCNVEWRPVISVRDAKLANRSATAGRSSLVTGVLNMGKDEDGDEDDDGREKLGSSLLDRPGGTTALGIVSHNERFKQQQQSLDTDSTWEESSSSSLSSDNEEKKNKIGCKSVAANKDSGPQDPTNSVVHGNVVHANDYDESSAVRLETGLPSSGIVEPARPGVVVGEQGCSQLALRTSKVCKDELELELESRRLVGGGVATCLSQPQTNNNNNSIPIQLRQARRAGGGDDDDEQLLPRCGPLQQQVALDGGGCSENNSQNFHQNSASGMRRSRELEEGLNDVELIAIQRADENKEEEEEKFDSSVAAAAITQTSKVCKTPFKFNAHLPAPSKLVETAHQKAKQTTDSKLIGPKIDASNREHTEVAVRPKISQASGGLSQVRREEEEEAEEESCENNNLAPNYTSGMVLDEADARLLQVLNHKRNLTQQTHQQPQQQQVQTQTVIKTTQEGEDDDNESQKRLSIYENMPPTSLEQHQQQQSDQQNQQQQQLKQKRGWRKAPWPPEKPAHLVDRMTTSAAAAAAAADSSPPGSPSAWSVGDDVTGCLPKLPVAKLEQLNKALRGSGYNNKAIFESQQPQQGENINDLKQDDDGDAQHQVAPAKPKRRLITMTSIIQDPNDELMVADGAPISQDTKSQTANQKRQQQNSSGKFQPLHDSTISLATNTDNGSGNDDDSDSSFAAAALSRQRLVNRFEPSKPPDHQAVPSGKPTPRCPAFQDGKSAGSGSGSLVKRLAKTFDQTAQEHRASLATKGTGSAPAGQVGKPPLRGGPQAGAAVGAAAAPGSRASLEFDDPKSESTWYDATNHVEQLDEQEVAEFLAEFDDDNEKQQQHHQQNPSESEGLSTGNDDPFVTVAESTLEEPIRPHGGDPEPDEDDTLNDEVDVDEEDEFDDLEGDGNEEEEEEQQQQEEEKGKDKTSSRSNLVVPSDDLIGSNELARGSERAVAVAVAVEDTNTNNNNNNNIDRAIMAEEATQNNYPNSRSSSYPLFAHDNKTDDNSGSGSYVTARHESSSSSSNNNASNNATTILPSSSSNAALPAQPAQPAVAAAAIASTPNNPTIDAHRLVSSDVGAATDDDDHDGEQTQTIHNNTTVGVHPIDKLKFKNSLNHIIASRRSSPHPSAQMALGKSAGGCNDNTISGQVVAARSVKNLNEEEEEEVEGKKMKKKSNKNKSKLVAKQDKTTPLNSTDDVTHKCLVDSKELKGLTRYYYALLGRSSRRHKAIRSAQTKVSEQKFPNQPINNLNGQRDPSPSAKSLAQIDDCIHSSSSSSSSSLSSLCSSPSYSRSSSPSAVSSRSHSPEIFSPNRNSSRNSLDNDNDNKKLASSDANKCSRLYDELQRILAHRLAKQETLHSRPQSGLSGDSNVEPGKVGTNSPGNSLERLQETPDDFGADFYSSWSLANNNNNNNNNNFVPSSERDDQISLSSSSVSSESIPEIKQRQNLQKLYHIVNEIHSSEAKFVDTLKLLNENFRRHINFPPGAGSGSGSSNMNANECISSLLKHLPQLQALNENLLEEFRQARDQWPRTRKIAHVLVKLGPFLKHYSTYIREFDSLQQQFLDCLKKYPQFAERVREFESLELCQKLTIQHHLLKPIQRIPQYRLLLQQYLHHLKPDDIDYEDTVSALEVVSRVAEHANQSMNEGANFAKLLALQAKIVGKQRDIVQPGRLFIKEGELLKVCRKQIQPRWFVLLNDSLLYLTQIQSSDILYLNNELPLDDCQISTPNEGKQSGSNVLIGQQFETEFSVCTKTRSFALIAKSASERDDWVSTFRKTIDEHLARRRSFSIRQQQQFTGVGSGSGSGAAELSLSPAPLAPEASDLATSVPQQEQQQWGHLLGQKAPLWTPDSRVSMCQLCTSSFSALFRRHHCRACGRVVCSACSSNKAPLIYLKCRSARVCDHCFEQLKSNIQMYYLGGKPHTSCPDELRRLDEHFRTLLKSQFVRHAGLKGLRQLASSNRGSGSGSGSGSLGGSGRGGGGGGGMAKPAGWPHQERAGNDSGSTISGYLHRRHPTKPKWKRKWFVIRDKVLYVYRAIDDVAAISSIPLLGYTVDQPRGDVDGLDPKSLIRLCHLSGYVPLGQLPVATQQVEPPQLLAPPGQLKRKTSKGKGDEQKQQQQHLQPAIEHLFKAESNGAAERWLEAFRKSVVLDNDNDGQ